MLSSKLEEPPACTDCVSALEGDCARPSPGAGGPFPSRLAQPTSDPAAMDDLDPCDLTGRSSSRRRATARPGSKAASCRTPPTMPFRPSAAGSASFASDDSSRSASSLPPSPPAPWCFRRGLHGSQAISSLTFRSNSPSASQLRVDRHLLQNGADLINHALGTPSGKCLPCAVEDEICARWGAEAILRSRGYLGTGIKSRRFVHAMRNGNASIGVLGGSMSACVDVNVTDCYPTVLARTLEAHFGVLPILHNGALSATGSDFFAECWPLRLPSNLDLVIVEFSVNDPPDYINRGVATLLHSLLSLPTPPAIILLDLYSPRSSNWYSGTESITTLGPYFDLPVIRCALARSYTVI